MSARKMTNAEFGKRVGCDPSFASYLRSGKRMPGADLFIEIILAFELDPIAAMDAYREGPEGFSAYLRRTVFDVEVPDVPSGTESAGTDQVG
jgi:transcriptional regulator with XRE-family HTH domain